jgi:integrase
LTNNTISPRSVRYMHTLIQEALEQAVKEGKIIRNPAKATKPPKQERKEANYLTSEQIEEFLNSITDDRWYTAFLTVLGSGLRLGELVALTWGNIDFGKGVIYVKQAASRVDTFEATGPKTKLVFQLPKTNKGLRAIALPENVLAELKHWKTQQAQEKLLMGSGYQDQGFVFAWPDGRIVDPTTLSKHFLGLIRQHGIENIHFHSLRHSYASMLLKAGVHPKVAQENLGHSTISMTLDIYSHVAPELKVAAAQQINGVLNVKRPSVVKEAK